MVVTGQGNGMRTKEQSMLIMRGTEVWYGKSRERFLQEKWHEDGERISPRWTMKWRGIWRRKAIVGPSNIYVWHREEIRSRHSFYGWKRAMVNGYRNALCNLRTRGTLCYLCTCNRKVKSTYNSQFFNLEYKLLQCVCHLATQNFTSLPTHLEHVQQSRFRNNK